MKPCVVFDFDGTLVPSVAVKRRMFAAVVADVPGAAAAVEAILARPDHGDRHRTFALLAETLGETPATAATWAAAYGTACAEAIAALPDVPGTRRALQDLSAAGARLYVASATPQAALESLIEARGLGAYFDAVWGSPREKADVLAHVMAETGATPATMVMVGDQIADRDAARTVGCCFLAVAATADSPLTPDDADAFCRDLDAAPALVAALVGAADAPAVAAAG